MNRLKFFLVAAILVLATAVRSNPILVSDIFPSPSFDLVAVSIESEGMGTFPMVRVDLKLYVETEVRVEIRDALGKKCYETTAFYPEGDQQIRVGIGGLNQGAYFVKVSTELEEKSDMILLEKP